LNSCQPVDRSTLDCRLRFGIDADGDWRRWCRSSLARRERFKRRDRARLRPNSLPTHTVPVIVVPVLRPCRQCAVQTGSLKVPSFHHAAIASSLRGFFNMTRLHPVLRHMPLNTMPGDWRSTKLL
jgi:hypothetical protein